MKGNRLKATRIAAVILIVYLIFLSWRMFFYAYGEYYRGHNSGLRFNIIPFKTILGYISNMGSYTNNVWIVNIIGNICIFVPLGFLLPIVLKSKRDMRTTMLTSFFIIFFAETMQLILKIGVFDVDDLLLNLLGCFIGYIGFVCLRKFILKDRINMELKH